MLRTFRNCAKKLVTLLRRVKLEPRLWAAKTVKNWPRISIKHAVVTFLRIRLLYARILALPPSSFPRLALNQLNPGSIQSR